MLNEKVSELLNVQINKELYSAYLYLDISNYFYDEGLEGFGNWYYIQAQEERDHAMLFLKYLQDNGEKVELLTIDKPKEELKDHYTALKIVAEHEVYVTKLIHGIYDEASINKDYRTMNFLDWFVAEQGEEEKNADDMLKKYELFGRDSKSLYMLNSELSSRTYSAPSLQL